MSASSNIAFDGTCQQNAGATSFGGDVNISQNTTTTTTTTTTNENHILLVVIVDDPALVLRELRSALPLDKENGPMQSFGLDYPGAQMDEEHTGAPHGEKPTPGDGKKKREYVKALAYLSVVFVQAWLKYSATTSVLLLLL